MDEEVIVLEWVTESEYESAQSIVGEDGDDWYSSNEADQFFDAFQEEPVPEDAEAAVHPEPEPIDEEAVVEELLPK